MTVSILHTFSILSAPSMCSFYNLLISFFKKSYFQWLFPYSTHFQFYQRHLLLNIFKTSVNCLKWLGRWYRFLQWGCKQLFPCLSGVSHQYCIHFQFYQCHLWLSFLKLWYIALIDLVDDTGSFRGAANSYPPAYPVCQINTAHIFNFISTIYDWIL